MFMKMAHELRPFRESEYPEKGILTVPDSCFISAAPRFITVSFPFRFTMGDDGSQRHHEYPVYCDPTRDYHSSYTFRQQV
jgi:hypothetical protein